MDPPNREHAATSVYRVFLRTSTVLFAAVHGLFLVQGRSEVAGSAICTSHSRKTTGFSLTELESPIRHIRRV